ncbi:MAG: hypothetical protein IIB54_02970 [Planctomycetes bacterium]|nr:hypothetical protein [Planctomycetota bacterium]
MKNMGTPMKIVLGLVAVLILIGLIWFMVGFNLWALLILIAGVIVVLVIFLMFLGLLKWLQKRKSDPFERELASNTGAVPGGVTEASSRARLDDLRQKFEQGIETFRANGKDLYSLPWYVIVGEPGSGKTEALRHSNIGFPPGLQDELQGSGGTINMDWWFTNHAIILDTAGRLLFDEASTTSNPEWTEFLKLLQKHRTNCPINGLMLVIPADSLIRDTADEIHEKGGRIARQLDLIQRTLGVRFPVFILITKSDLINGFREFFDELSDPQLQHQIMGWSNPGNLDDPFDPEDVIDHIYTVQERLERRRLGLLLDPVSKEGAMSRRTDEVDAMFAFPESITGVVPRLRRYLELIFVSGEWSSKPLFLRGIYFVSAMREGSALDADLAEVLGVPVEQLPEGRIWERDRSFFLRDLFLKKIFRERGLVTRTSNTSQLKRKRRIILIGTGIAASLLLLGLTMLQIQKLNKTIVQPQKIWETAANIYTQPADGDTFPVIVGGFQNHNADEKLVYLGNQPADLKYGFTLEDGTNATISKATEEINRQVKRRITVPLLFRPVNLFLRGSSKNLLDAKRLDAGRVIFELSVLHPLTSRALKGMASTDPKDLWSPAATAALTELLRIYALNDESLVRSEKINLAPLFEYVLRPSSTETRDDTAFKEAAEDIEGLQATFDALYNNRLSSDRWPGKIFDSNHPPVARNLSTGIDRFVAFVVNIWKGEGEGEGEFMEAIRGGLALDKFSRVEKELWDTYAPDEEKAPRMDLTDWVRLYPQLGINRPGYPHSTLSNILPKLQNRDFSDWYMEIVEEGQARLKANYDAMIGIMPLLPDDDVETSDDTVIHSSLLGFKRQLEKERTTFEGMLDPEVEHERMTILQNDLFGTNPRSQQRAFAERAGMYAEVEKHRLLTRTSSNLVALSNSIFSMKSDSERLTSEFVTHRTANREDRINRTVNVATHVLSLADSDQTEGLVAETLRTSSPPQSPREVEELVALIVEQSPNYEPFSCPRLEMTVWADGNATLNTDYHHEAAPACLDMLIHIENHLRLRSASPAEAKTVRRARHNYIRNYLAHWKTLLRDGRLFKEYDGDWRQFRNDLNFAYSTVNEKLRQLALQRRDAIDALPRTDDWTPDLVQERDDTIQWIEMDLTALSPSPAFDRKCGKWFDSWRKDRTGSFDFDRRSILQLDSTDFLEGFLSLYGAASNEHYVDFWRSLTDSGLNVLAQASEKKTDEAHAVLQDLRWFPLAPLHENANLDQLGEINSPEQRILSWEDVLQAREAMQNIRPENTSGDDGVGRYAEGEIGNPGTDFKVAEIDNALGKIRGKRMTPDERRRFDSLSALLRALPSDPKAPPLNCKLTYLGEKEATGGRSLICLPLPLLRLERHRNGNVQSNPYRLDRRNKALATALYPGGDKIVLVFGTTEQAGEEVPIEINGPWSVLALLHKFQGQRTPENPLIWQVEMIVPYKNSSLSFWLQLEFDTQFPTLDEWPQ